MPLPTLGDTLAATAKVFSVRLLAALENLEDGHDKLELDFAIVQVKPWLDLKDKSTLASIKNVIRKVKSGSKEAAQLPSELNQAMLELQDVIGLKGSELCRLTDASTQKIKDTVYAMNTLGTCFANLESKYTTWIKSVPSEDQMSEDQKSLNEDMNSLMMTAKILLACQSCVSIAMTKQKHQCQCQLSITNQWSIKSTMNSESTVTNEI